MPSRFRLATIYIFIDAPTEYLDEQSEQVYARIEEIFHSSADLNRFKYSLEAVAQGDLEVTTEIDG